MRCREVERRRVFMFMFMFIAPIAKGNATPGTNIDPRVCGQRSGKLFAGVRACACVVRVAKREG